MQFQKLRTSFPNKFKRLVILTSHPLAAKSAPKRHWKWASTTAPVVLGAVLGWAFNRWASRRPHPDRAKQLGIIVASGLIVGESLFGVLLAGVIVFSGKPSPLSIVGDAFAPAANVIGAVAFAIVLAALLRWSGRLSQGTAGSA